MQDVLAIFCSKSKYLYSKPKSKLQAISFRLLTNNWTIDQRYLQNMIAFLEGGMGEMFEGIEKSHSDFEKEA